MSRDDYPPVVKYEAANMVISDTPIKEALERHGSQYYNHPRWDKKVLDAVGELEIKLNAAKKRIAELEQEKKAAAIKALEDAAHRLLLPGAFYNPRAHDFLMGVVAELKGE